MNLDDSPSEFDPPALRVEPDTLRSYFRAVGTQSSDLLRNYHREDPVHPSRHGSARPASVLMGLIVEATPRFLMTRRHESISAPGQICFPGGTRDPEDTDAIATALREMHEETGVEPQAIEPLGVLGRYYSHSGHEITPVVALLHPPFELAPHPGEVEEIVYLAARDAFRPTTYELVQYDRAHPRAHYFAHADGSRITGPTVCLLMHLYECLAAHAEETAPGPPTAGRTS